MPRFGASFYGPDANFRKSLALGDLVTVFSSEILAIKHCSVLVCWSKTNEHIYVWSDFQAVIKPLLKLSTDCELV